MIKRVNFTDRKKIPRSLVEFVVFRGEPPSFDAQFKFNGKFPTAAAVFVEATSAGSASVERFDFGTIGAISPPRDRTLREVQGEHVIFTVKVVDQSETIGRLLGVAAGLRARVGGDEDDRTSHSILPLNPADLGQRVWRLNYHPELFLELNIRIPSIKQVAQIDRHFFSLVYPEVIRQILERIVVVEGRTEPDETSTEWQDLWLRLARKWHPDGGLPPVLPPRTDPSYLDDEYFQELDSWISTVVAEFCNHHEIASRYAEMHVEHE